PAFRLPHFFYSLKISLVQRPSVESRLYPETAAGGFCRDDHRMAFLVRLNAVLKPTMRVLDLGAGRGKWRDDPAVFRASLGGLRGRCALIIGADVDAAILENESVDERVHLDNSGMLPFADGQFELVSAFSVLEHIEEPSRTAAEIRRVLRPGGWLIGWTPNRYGYVGIGARIIPTALTRKALRLLEPRREEHDSFPPFYRLNSRTAFRKYFPPAYWEDLSYTYNGMPFYHGENIVLARVWQALFTVLPPVLRGYWMVILRRR
ncbi:MAG: class I SAM-dependent methyltransferase, partial [Methylocella sp.]